MSAAKAAKTPRLRSPNRLRSSRIGGRLVDRIREAGGLFKDAGSGWHRHKASKTAAIVAYFGVFSLAPMLVIMVVVAGYWFGKDAAEGLIVDRLSEMLGAEAATFLESVIARAYVSGASVPATLVAVTVLLFGASRVVGAIRGALNDAWGVESRAGGGVKGYILTKGFDLVMVLGVGFMFLATMLANVATTAVISRFADLVPLPSLVLRVGSVVFSLVVVAFFVAIIFRVLPNKRTPWLDVLVGAALTAVLFAIGNYAIGIYLGRAGFGSVFGAAGALAVIMFWMYYTAQIILFGAELTRAHHERRASGRPSL